MASPRATSARVLICQARFRKRTDDMAERSVCAGFRGRHVVKRRDDIKCATAAIGQIDRLCHVTAGQPVVAPRRAPSGAFCGSVHVSDIETACLIGQRRPAASAPRRPTDPDRSELEHLPRMPPHSRLRRMPRPRIGSRRNSQRSHTGGRRSRCRYQQACFLRSASPGGSPVHQDQSPRN